MRRNGRTASSSAGFCKKPKLPSENHIYPFGKTIGFAGFCFPNGTSVLETTFMRRSARGRAEKRARIEHGGIE
jgi:hypothetical protein